MIGAGDKRLALIPIRYTITDYAFLTIIAGDVLAPLAHCRGGLGIVPADVMANRRANQCADKFSGIAIAMPVNLMAYYPTQNTAQNHRACGIVPRAFPPRRRYPFVPAVLLRIRLA